MLSLTALLLLAGASVPFVAHTAASATPAAAGLLIPLYIYPGAAWTTIIQQKEAYPSVPITVVINPDSGPGSSYSSTYGTWIIKLRDAGITVLGYVPTLYGSATTSSVESQIAAYKSMYDINGIFLDQMSNVATYESYYKAITTYAHSDGLSPVVGNPGTDVPAGYIGAVDVLLVFENGYLPTLARLQSITMGQSPTNFAVVSYDIPTLSMSSVTMIAGYASYLYITNGVLPNPYGSLPTYFSALVADINSIPVTAPTPTSYSITVDSITSSGAALNGMYTTITYNGTVVDKGFTPLVYTGPAGNPYTVCVDNYQSYVFSHWDDGLTNSCRVFGLSKDLVLTATYNT